MTCNHLNGDTSVSHDLCRNFKQLKEESITSWSELFAGAINPKHVKLKSGDFGYKLDTMFQSLAYILSIGEAKLASDQKMSNIAQSNSRINH